MADESMELGTELAPEWQALLERGRKVGADYQERLKHEEVFSTLNPALMGQLFVEVAEQLLAKPETLQQAQASLVEDYGRLWQATAAALRGEAAAPVIEPQPGDRRFKDEDWTANPTFSAIKQFYLLAARWLESMVADAEGLDPKTRQKALFYMRQFLSAVAPTNFLATNPKVIRATAASQGENLRRGFTHLLDDMERSRGPLQVALTDAQAFRLGENIATTPGKVVYQNGLMQLIQYTPTTDKAYRRPLMIVPPWINKYYVLDMQPKNSFIRWAVGEGHTVFVISWINPEAEHSDKNFDDYLLDGPMAALDAIERATGEREVNALGYCIGGTLLACTLAHMAARDDRRVASATFFTTMLDFAEPGELGVFIDEAQIAMVEKHMEKKGFLDGSQMAQVFSMLRENDLIWSAFINNYLLGKDPPAFDLLYWNSDSTRMPAMMHGFYLREMYLNNRLIEPDALTLAGTPIDLHRIETPAYFLSAREDHIAPWRSTFAATRLFSGSVRFVLAASGHIAGVINPPVAGKYNYWTSNRKGRTPEAWLKSAERKEGSWWPDWARWVARKGGGKVAAREPGAGALPALEDAPGSYVKMRL
ncbi:MAG: class I poly(R)-hydroxyalkanoic acid synthase [Rhodospirillales bacterium]|nr:class I poly(R)-hydroxyalkanoic acid synthase [Rhodospirillales bacterium]